MKRANVNIQLAISSCQEKRLNFEANLTEKNSNDNTLFACKSRKKEV